MSLLDDVSIVVTPNGYKAGELYAVVPVPTEGAEEVTNGDFSGSSTGWSESGTWTYGNNNEVCTGNGTNQMLTQSGILTSGKLYTYSIDIISSSLSSQEIRVYVGSTDYITHTLSGVAETISGNTVSSGANLVIRVTSSNTSGVLTIDNVSVKEYTSADMDVTRATAATRVDEDGLVNYAEIIGDEEVTNGNFATDSDWDKTGTWSIESNYATSNANGLTQYLGQDVGIVNGRTYKITYTVLSNSLNNDRLLMSGTSSFTTTQIPSSIGQNTVYLTASQTPSSGYDVRFANSATNTSGIITLDNISVKEVTRDNVPRIDYTGGGCPHILAEPQRTNLVTYSSDFSESSWTPTDITITNNASASPEGVNNASKIILDNGSSGSCDLRVNSTNVTLGTSYTFSVFAKAGEFDKIELDFSNSRMGVSYVLAELTNGTITHRGVDNTADSIEDYGNGWYRITLTGTAIATGTTALIFRLGANPTGDGTSGFYIFGADFQEGSYPTSYIPTSGSTVTRNQDTFTRDGISSLINDSEGVLFLEMAALADDLTFRSISLNDGTNTNSVGIRYRTTSNRINAIIKDGNGVTFQMNFDVSDITQFNKIALKYKSGDNSLYINGTEVLTSSSTFSFTSVLNDASFNRGDGNDDFFGKVKQLQVYTTALTDAQLTSLTS